MKSFETIFLPTLKLLEVKDNKLIFETYAKTEYLNAMNNLHGGSIASLLSIAGQISVLASDKKMRMNSTNYFNVAYAAPGIHGD